MKNWERKCEIEFQLESIERAKEWEKRIDCKLIIAVEKAKIKRLYNELELINSEEKLKHK